MVILYQEAGQHFSRFDQALLNPIFRALIVAIGVAATIHGLWWLVRRVGRVFGIGRPVRVSDLAASRFGGDLQRAQSAVRSAVPSALLSLGMAGCLILLGTLGAGREEVQGRILVGVIVWVCVFWPWRVLERDFAWPGVLVPKEVRGTPGMREVRRQRDARHMPWEQ